MGNLDALVGRKTQEHGKVRGWFVDRGTVNLIIESVDGNLYEAEIHAVRLQSHG